MPFPGILDRQPVLRVHPEPRTLQRPHAQHAVLAGQAVQQFLASYPRHDSLFSVTPLQTRLYDAAGRLIQLEQRSGTHLLARYEYELDALGYRMAVTETVNPPQPPRAGFYATPLSGLAPLTVTFVNTSTGDLVSQLWTFGDGLTSTLANPVHRYDVAGIYTVTVSDGTGGTVTDTCSEKDTSKNIRDTTCHIWARTRP